MKNNENIQHQLTQESLYLALLELMEKESFSKITITKLVNRAGVSRMAFYRNYTSKEDILMQHLDQKFNSYFEEILHLNDITFYQIIYLFFRYTRLQKRLIRNLVNHNLDFIILQRYDLYIEQVISLFSFTFDSSYSEKYLVDFISGGFYKLLIGWAKNDFYETEEVMAQFLQKLIPNQVSINKL
ncbi:MAG: TetR/AcrR family transcriptional regulator [Streptococcaceae bacterium]|jgi:AcrR family transcriptional regulator|nr:TetR/AcrR family transcriptional regulator [Streptococcaceae bacterium]